MLPIQRSTPAEGSVGGVGGASTALLAPTDAALGKPVVTNPAVPAVTREALNLESGLNDGICVPIVVLLLGLAVGRKSRVGQWVTWLAWSSRLSASER